MPSRNKVLAVTAAVIGVAVLAPVGVYATSGSLVHITDPVTPSKKARIGSGGGLLTEQRSGGLTNAVNFSASGEAVGFFPLYETGNNLAVTELTVSPTAGAQGDWFSVQLVAYRRTSGTAACGGTGWTRTTLRSFNVNTYQPVTQLLFSGPPLVLPQIRSGQRLCFGFQLLRRPTGAALTIGGTAYRF